MIVLDAVALHPVRNYVTASQRAPRKHRDYPGTAHKGKCSEQSEERFSRRTQTKRGREAA